MLLPLQLDKRNLRIIILFPQIISSNLSDQQLQQVKVMGRFLFSKHFLKQTLLSVRQRSANVNLIQVTFG